MFIHVILLKGTEIAKGAFILVRNRMFGLTVGFHLQFAAEELSTQITFPVTFRKPVERCKLKFSEFPVT